MGDISRNIALAIVSTGAYAATDLNNKDILRDSITFGVLNGLAQQLTPYFIQDKAAQQLFVDPLIASIAQGIVKMIIYQDFEFQERVMLRSIVAGISSSALIKHHFDGDKRY